MNQVDGAGNRDVFIILEKLRYRLVREILQRELHLRHVLPLTNGFAVNVDAVLVHREAVVLPAFLAVKTEREKRSHCVEEFLLGEYCS